MRGQFRSIVGLYLSRVVIGLIYVCLAICVGGEVVVTRIFVLGWITDVGPALQYKVTTFHFPFYFSTLDLQGQFVA